MSAGTVSRALLRLNLVGARFLEGVVVSGVEL